MTEFYIGRVGDHPAVFTHDKHIEYLTYPTAREAIQASIACKLAKSNQLLDQLAKYRTGITQLEALAVAEVIPIVPKSDLAWL